MVCLSYRGFWKSTGRASQRGIERDAAAALSYAKGLQDRLGSNTRFVLWGQSIGAGVATSVAASISRSSSAGTLDGLILETPFVSVRDMLVTLYPQRWLPYRYLWPFLWNFWDSKTALKTLAEARRPKVLVLTAGKDEVVPPDQPKQIIDLCRSLSFDLTHAEVPGALHTEAMGRREGSLEVLRFLKQVSEAHATGHITIDDKLPTDAHS